MIGMGIEPMLYFKTRRIPLPLPLSQPINIILEKLFLSIFNSYNFLGFLCNVEIPFYIFLFCSILNFRGCKVFWRNFSCNPEFKLAQQCLL